MREGEILGSLRNIGECRAKANKPKRAKGPKRLNKPSEGKGKKVFSPMTLRIAATLLLPPTTPRIAVTLLCGVASIVLSLSGCLTLSVVSHARGRKFREFKEYREV